MVAQNDKDLRAERGLSSFDQRHTLNLSWVLHLDRRARRRANGVRATAPRLDPERRPDAALRHAVDRAVLGNLSNSGGTGAVGSGRADATGLPVHSAARFFNLPAFTAAARRPLRQRRAQHDSRPGPFSTNLSFGRIVQHRRDAPDLDLRVESTTSLNTTNYHRASDHVVNASNYGLPSAAPAMRTVTRALRFRF